MLATQGQKILQKDSKITQNCDPSRVGNSTFLPHMPFPDSSHFRLRPIFGGPAYDSSWLTICPSVGSWSGNRALLWCLFGPVHVLGTYPIPQVPLRGQWGHSGPSLPTDPQTPCPPAVALTPACKRMHLRTTRAHGHFVWTSCSLSDVVLSAPPLGHQTLQSDGKYPSS